MLKPTFFALTAATLMLAACDDTTTTTATASPAEANCLAAVANQTGTGDVSTISVTPSEAGTSVMVQVAGAEAPWNCVANADGSVADVYYTSEG
jgi:uncharacterized lipoprotein YajG